jgi:hypothetical protein
MYIRAGMEWLKTYGLRIGVQRVEVEGWAGSGYVEPSVEPIRGSARPFSTDAHLCQSRCVADVQIYHACTGVMTRILHGVGGWACKEAMRGRGSDQLTRPGTGGPWRAGVLDNLSSQQGLPMQSPECAGHGILECDYPRRRGMMNFCTG